MPYTLMTLQVVTTILSGTTAGLYFFHINLWQDQAVFLACTSALIFGFVTLCFLTVGYLAKIKMKWWKWWLHYFYAFGQFSIMFTGLIYFLWLKPAG